MRDDTRPLLSVTVHLTPRHLRRALLGLCALALVPIALAAAPVGTLSVFENGAVASASEVNGNFAALKAAVDDNAGRVPVAMVSFDGTACGGAGNTCTLRMARGVGSVVRSGAGVWQVNWTTPFAGQNYLVLGTCQMHGYTGPKFGLESTSTLSNFQPGFAVVGCRDYSNTGRDTNLVHVVAFGE